jgi:hypothetical protein
MLVMARNRWPAAAIVILGIVWGVASRASVRGQPLEAEQFDLDARMHGNGRAGDLSYVFDLWCEPDERHNQLTMQWGGRNRFTLGTALDGVCLKHTAIDPGTDRVNFDTHHGEATGTYNGVDGARARWTFTTATPAAGASAEIVITDAAGGTVLRFSGRIDGQHRASGRALLPAAPGVDPVNVVHSVEIDAIGRTTSYSVTPLPPDAITDEPLDTAVKPDAVVEPRPSRVHPDLERMLAEASPDDRVVVIVNRREDMTVPRFPDLARGISPDSPEARPVLAAQAAVIEGLRVGRRRSTDDFLEQVGRVVDLRLVETLWLVNAFVADIRVRDVRTLAAFPDVLYVEPNVYRITAMPPTHEGPQFPHGDVADGRALMRSDNYFNLSGMTGGAIGLIDTGVAPHALLATPFDVRFQGDCSDGGTFCVDVGNPGFDLFDCWDHGTSTAAVVGGNGSLGNAVRGVTDIHVDSWKVWLRPNAELPNCNNDGVTALAVARAFGVGLSLFDRVFAAVIQVPEPEHGAIATAADKAFDAGAVVVAANGNCAVSPDCNVPIGPPSFGTVRAPGNAHKALGIGVYNVVDLSTGDYQGRGPTVDGRIKPDIQAPTDVKTASNASFIALKERFGGTSAATPFAAGAAALMRNWLRKYNTFDPGYTYARIILSGNAFWSGFGYSNVFGAGHLQLPVPCGQTGNWGKVTFAQPKGDSATSVNIPLPLTSGASLAVALWWPESAGEAHDDIDVYVLDPNGIEQAKAISQPSVFERTEVAGPLVAGTWTVKIKGASINSAPQDVYWTADVRKPCLRARDQDR